MSGKVLFACSKCFSRHPFEELSSGRQLCKNCRTPSTSTSAIKCTYCRSEFQPVAKSQNACKKCEHNLNKYGKPSACECCKVVAAFGGSKCMRCASYEAKYGAPVQCEECKLRSAFDKHDENKKVNGKVLCWLCTCAFKRAVLKAQQEGRIVAPKKRAHEKSHRDGAAPSAKKSARATADIAAKSSSNVSTSNAASLDLPEKIARSGSSSVGNAVGNGTATTASSVSSVTITPAAVNIDPNSADHVVQMTNLKERIASLEKRLSQKDKELLDKDKLVCTNYVMLPPSTREIEISHSLCGHHNSDKIKVRLHLGLHIEHLLPTRSRKKNACGVPFTLYCLKTTIKKYVLY